MKHSTILFLALHATATNAWTFTWRTSSGSATTESGTGPSSCIAVNHAKGQIFAADGEGEENINMLLFSNDECDGEPAGMATENFVKEASLDLKGFQVVRVDGGDGDEEEDDLDQTVTLPTVPATTTLPATSTSTGSEDEDDQTFTLPTEPATTTSAESTTTSDDTSSSTESPTATETESETDSETDSGSEPSPTETDSESETESGEEDPAPTDAGSSLGFSKSGIAGVVVCALVGGWAVDALF
ncbi:uncharacterized protein BDV14DRAFT_169363 [Aspergillus stella-maris]|uniref:uncharacterized protein n=1 Tax=Aspergillus stella-maris TaxID=1810926 RepID=UPI003CCE0BDF